MGFLQKLKFWRKKNTNKPTKVNECVSTEGPRFCDAATSMDPTVMCAVYTETEENRMDGGGAAAEKQLYEGEREMNSKKIREITEELVVSKRLNAELMLKINSVENEVRKYVEAPVSSWSDDCDCKQNVSKVAELLRKFINTEKDAKKSKQEDRDTNKSTPEAWNTTKSIPGSTSGQKTKVDQENQTEPNSIQRDCDKVDKQENLRKLEDDNRKLSELVEIYERKNVLLSEEMESILRDRASHIQHIKMRHEDEIQSQIMKMRDMREELIWYKKRLRGIHMPTEFKVEIDPLLSPALEQNLSKTRTSTNKQRKCLSTAKKASSIKGKDKRQ